MIGKTVGYYRVLKQIGKGGMGEVFLAEDTRLQRQLALKFLPADMLDDTGARDRFLREARTAAALNHPNIVTIYAIDQCGEKIYIAMEYVKGKTLKQIIPLPLSDGSFFEVAMQICLGLSAAHRAGVIHRDIKPQNIIVDDSGRVRILDFGLAKLTKSQNDPSDIYPIGTLPYMSPEHLRGDLVDHRTDIWSLGVVLYQSLTGEMPFRGPNPPSLMQAILNQPPRPPTELVRQLPAGLEDIILTCLQKEPERRYATMDPLVVALESLHGTVGAHKAPPNKTREAEQRHATVMCVEISGGTGMFGKNGTEESVAAINWCFEIFDTIIKKYGGRIDRITGSWFIALFGVPTAIEEAPKKALNAAVEIRNRLRQRDRKKEAKIPLAVRMGIDSGLVLTGPFNAVTDGQYRVMGDAVTLAFQLKEQADDWQILTGDGTHKHTADHFAFKPLKSLVLKENHVTVFELTSDQTIDHYRTFSPDRAVFPRMIGRDKELDRLRRHVEKVIGGGGSAVCITGEAGVGKSRLIEELKQTDIIRKITLLEGHCQSHCTRNGYHPIIDLLSHWSGAEKTESETGTLWRLERKISKHFPGRTDELLPFVAAMMGLPLRGKHARRVHGIEGHTLFLMILKSVREMLRQSAAWRPLIAVLYDFHWADLSTVELVEALARVIKNTPVLFILEMRPEFRDTTERLLKMLREKYNDYFTEISLEPLPRENCRQLLRGTLHDGEGPEAVMNLITRRTEGNPFFMEEVIRNLLAEGLMVQRRGKYRVTEKIDPKMIPDTVEDVLMARVCRLDDGSVQLLKVASVIGRNFFYKVLAEVVKTDGNIDEQLARLSRAHLISRRPDSQDVEYRFVRALTQEVVYNSIPRGRRRNLHLQVAGAIETVFSDQLRGFHGMLAYHYSKGRNPERAEPHLISAGREALRAAASYEAINYYKEALDIYIRISNGTTDPDKITMLKKNIALALAKKGHTAESVKYFDDVLNDWGLKFPRYGWQSVVKIIYNLFIVLVRLYLTFNRRRKKPSRRIDEILNMASKRGPQLAIGGKLRFFADNISHLRRLMGFDMKQVENGISIFIEGSGVFIYMDFLTWIGQKILNRARGLLDPADARPLLVYTYYRLMDNFFHGHWTEEIRLDEDLLDRNLHSGEFFYPVALPEYLGYFELERGNFAVVDRLVARIREIREIYGSRLTRGRELTLDCKRLIKLRRDFPRALQYAEEAIGISEKAEQIAIIVLAGGLKAYIEILTGDMEGAAATFQRLEGLVPRRAYVSPSRLGQLVLARFSFGLVKLEECIKKNDGAGQTVWRKHARRAGKKALKLVARYAGDRVEAYKLMGMYHRLRGNVRGAVKWWNRAVAEGERLGARVELARTFLEAGRYLRDTEKEAQGRDYLERGARLCRDIGLTAEPGAKEG